MAQKITKSNFSKLAEKIKKDAATPEEKLEALKLLNASIKKADSMVVDLIAKMKQEIK